MKDQVDALVSKGVKAASLDSTLNAERSSWVKSEVINGNLKILYVAPERYLLCSLFGDDTNYDRLNNEGFVTMMSRVKISLLAVDESHCISQVCPHIAWSCGYLQCFDSGELPSGRSILRLLVLRRNRTLNVSSALPRQRRQLSHRISVNHSSSTPPLVFSELLSSDPSKPERVACSVPVLK